MQHKDGDTFVENGILVELKYIDLQSDDDLVPRKGHNKKWVPNNIAEYFFFDEYGFLSINEKRIRDCYEELTGTMSSIYLNMRGVYNTYAEKALNQDDIKRGIDFP